MVIVCSRCKKILKDNDIELREKEINQYGIREVYYITPCCNHKNIVAIKSKKTDRIQKDITNAQKMNDTKLIAELAKQLRKDMEKLMLEYGGNNATI